MLNYIVHAINGNTHKSMIFEVLARDALDIPGRFASLRHGISLCCALSITDKERDGYAHVARYFGMVQHTCLNRLQLISVRGITELPSIPDMPMIAPSRPILPLPYQSYLDGLPWV